jgi:hypothetical protein
MAPSLTFAICLLLDARTSGKELEGLVVDVEALKTPSRASIQGHDELSYPYTRYFHEVDEELMCRLIYVNVEGVTRVVLQGMVETRESRGSVTPFAHYQHWLQCHLRCAFLCALFCLPPPKSQY